MKNNELQLIYESVIAKKLLDPLVLQINNDIEKKQYRNAKETLNGIKNMSIGGERVLDMPEYADLFKQLADKLGTDITSTEEAKRKEKEARAAARTPEALLAAAKECNFENAQLGYMNGWSSGSKNYEILKLHSKCKEKDPENHKTVTRHPYGRYRGVSETRCPCGFSYGVDSTD